MIEHNERLRLAAEATHFARTASNALARDRPAISATIESAKECVAKSRTLLTEPGAPPPPFSWFKLEN